MEAPGGEGVAEQAAHGDRRDDGGGQHSHGDAEILRALQRQEGHGHGAADDGNRQAAHAHHGVEAAWHGGDERQHGEHARKNLAEQGAEKQRGEEQATAKTGAYGKGGGNRFYDEEPEHDEKRVSDVDVGMQGRMAGRHGFGGDAAEQADHGAAQGGARPEGNPGTAEQHFNRGDTPHDGYAHQAAGHTLHQHRGVSGVWHHCRQGDQQWRATAGDGLDRERAGQGGNHHERQRSNRVYAYNQLDAVKGAA